MPSGNRTGPAGGGPMSGRAAGFCAGNTAPGSMSPGFAGGDYPVAGRGWFGRGHRGGFRNRYWATGLTGRQRGAGGSPGCCPPSAATDSAEPSAEQELSVLRQQVRFMEEGIKRSQERIRELERELESEQE